VRFLREQLPDTVQAPRDIAFNPKRIDARLNDNEILPDAHAHNYLFANTGIVQTALDVIEELGA